MAGSWRLGSLTLLTLMSLHTSAASDTAVKLLRVRRATSTPVFNQDQYTGEVKNNAKGGHVILQVQATVTGLQGQLQYKLETQTDLAAQLFSINATTGDISVKDDLVITTTRMFSFRVLAYDTSNSTDTGSTLVNITIKANDHIPVFQFPSRALDVDETKTVGTVFLKLNATDGDGDSVKYSFDLQGTDGVAFTYFKLDASSGEMSILKALGNIGAKISDDIIIKTRVSAEDGRGGKSSIWVNLTLVLNRFAPILTGRDQIVKEKIAVNITITTMSAGDADISGPTEFRTLQYSLVGDDIAKEYFAVDKKRGVVTLIKRLDTLGSNSPDVYNLTIEVADGGNPPKRTTAMLRILVDRNYHRPVWESLEYYKIIPENLPVMASVMQVRSLDNDTMSPGNKIRYFMYELNRDKDMECFGVEQESGVVYVKKRLDECLRDNVIFRIRSKDDGLLPLHTVTETVVNITIVRNKFGPVFTNSTYTASTSFIEKVGGFILKVSAVDRDQMEALNRLNYTIVGEGSAMDMFAVDRNGLVTLKRNFDRTSLAEYKLRIMACDDGVTPKCAEATVTINVNRNVYEPQFDPLTYSATILQTQIVGEVFVTVNATDEDKVAPFNTIKYSMLNSGGAAEFFKIDDRNGDISLKKSFQTQRGEKRYTVIVEASDGGDPPKTAISNATVIINVLYNEFTPEFAETASDTINIDINQKLDVAIHKVKATDKDQPSVLSRVTYEMLGTAAAKNYFSLNSSTGELKVIRSLTDTAQYEFNVNVMARDGGRPFRYNTKTLRVLVNHNLFAPRLEANVLDTSISEDLRWGQPVYQLNVTDMDEKAPNNKVNHFIYGDVDAMKCFAVDKTSGLVTLKASLLDFPENPCKYKDSYNLQLIAEDEGVPVKRTSEEISLTVRVNRNRHAPVFWASPYRVDIREDTAVNSTVFTVFANDSDTMSPMNKVKFKVTGNGLAGTFFQVDEILGAIKVKANLSADSQASYSVRVTATDGSASNPKSAVTTLTVNILRNLYEPMFEITNQSKTILYTQALQQTIATVKATDADAQNPNNEVRYRLKGSTTAIDSFDIDSRTGEIFVKRSLSTTAKNYELTVEAYDQGSPSKTSSTLATVYVNVLQNENCPVFEGTPYKTTIRPDATPGSVVMAVSAKDNDTEGTDFSNVKYRATLVGMAGTLFRFDRELGQIKLVGDLSRDNANEYTIIVVAYDKAVPPCETTATTTITVDRNQAAPVFNMTTYTANILENRAVGMTTTPIVTVSASDADNQAPYNTVEYQFSASSKHTDKFLLDKTTGAIYLRSSLVGLKDNTYQLSVIAMDGGNPSKSSTEAEVTIKVYRNTHTPYFINDPYDITVSGSQLDTGSEFITIEATDADTEKPFNEIKFSIEGDDSATTFFTLIDATSGKIQVKEGLKTDKQNVYKIRVTVQDGGVPALTNTTVVTVRVNRNNFAPVINPISYEETIPETKTVGTDILTMTYEDKDTQEPYNLVSFQLQGDSSTLQYFSISKTGTISLIKSLIGTAKNQFQFGVAARDGGGEFQKSAIPAEVTISVDRNRFPPQFVGAPYAVSINKTHEGQVIKVITADNDTAATFKKTSYRLVGDGISSTFFAVDNDGVISVKSGSNLESDTQHIYYLRIRAEDGGQPAKYAETVVTVTVNRNEASPVFSKDYSSLEIKENFPIGGTIATITAIDKDVAPGNTVSYSLSAESPAKDYLFLNSESGTLVLTKTVKGITETNFQFKVIAKDNGKPEKTAAVEVILTILKDSSKLSFLTNDYSAKISESKPVNEEVLTLKTQPADNVNFTLVGDEKAKEYFNIDLTGGKITVKKSLKLDPLKPKSYKLRVEASYRDVTTQTVSADIIIEVMRNEHSPIFNATTYSRSDVPTNYPLGEGLLQVFATDDDKDQLTYNIIEDTPTTDLFYIHPVTGVIVLKTVFPEKDNVFVYAFDVQVSDDGVPQKNDTTKVTITFVADQLPTLTDFPSSVEVPERTNVGHSVLKVTANDPDLQDRLVYELVESYPSSKFLTINSTTGQIIISNPKELYSDTKTSYQIRVKVYDSAKPNKVKTGTFELKVLRNPNAPDFLEKTASVNLEATASLGTVVIKANATDKDEDILEFSISGGEKEKQLFYVHPSSGVITLKSPLKDLTDNQYKIEISVTDNRNPEKTDSMEVTVNILRDEAAPSFQGAPYIASINASLSVGAQVPLSSPIRAEDSGLRGSIKYEIVGDYPSPNFFQVDPDTGVISIKEPLDGDVTKQTKYTIRLAAYDSHYPDNKAMTTLTVSVNHNPNPPVFDLVSYSKTVQETIPKGSSILNVTATDLDKGAILYRVKGISPAPYFFDVDKSTGEITLRENLKLGKDLIYTLIIEAYDSQHPERTAEANVRITVNRNPNPPEFSHDANLEYDIYDTTPIGYMVVQLNATDKDQDTIRFREIGDSSALEMFMVDPQTGRVTLKKRLYPGTQKFYQLTVEASDQSHPEKSAQVKVQINIIRSTVAPSFVSEPYIRKDWKESSSPGDVVLKVTANDPDIRKKLRYEIIGDYPAPTFFAIDPDNGTVTMTTAVKDDPMKREVYEIRVVVYDTAYPDQKRETLVRVEVKRNANAPMLSTTTHNLTLNQAHPMGVDVYDFNATDADNDGITYTLIGSPASKDVFHVNPETGIVNLKKRLTDTTDNTYTVTVEACDDNKPQKCDNASLIVNVMREQSPPQFTKTPYNVNINELQERDSVIFTVTAADPELKGKIVFGQDGISPAPDYFSVDPSTGEVKVTGNLKEDRRLTYSLQVTVIDSAHPEQIQKALLTIFVQRNANAPSLEKTAYDITISEKQMLGETFLTINATDKDGDKLRFSLIGDGTASDFFMVDQRSGEVAVKKSLTTDEAKRNEYTLRIQVSDEAFPKEKTATAVVLVRVSRDLASPVFRAENISKTINESLPVNSVVTTVIADDDTQATVKYEIVGVYPAQSFFKVGETSGEISINRDLQEDSLQLTSYMLRIQAYDTRYPDNKVTARVTINVQRNVNGPIFVPSAVYSKEIGESLGAGETIIDVNAVDQDKKDILRYSIFNGTNNADELFMIEEKSGAIHVRKSLIGRPGQYVLTVMVTDQRGKSAYAVVEITVVNDRKKPEFQNLPYIIEALREDIKNNTNIQRIQATNPNGQSPIEYSISGLYPAEHYFTISRSSGQMKTKGSIQDDPLKLKSYTVRVIAYDTADPENSAAIDIRIPVTRNLYAPEFTESSYSQNITQKFPVGGVVLTLNATDKNQKDEIHYEFVENDDLISSKASQFFWINPTTGQILLKRSLSNIDLTEFKFKVRARDQSDPEKSTTASVTIFVDTSTVLPVFSRDKYTAEIWESSPVNASSILQVTATDGDLKGQIVYELIGDLSGPSYFRLAPDGRVSVRASLKGDIQTTYTLRIQAYDSSNPDQKTMVQAIITVKRNQFGPVFSASQHSVTLKEKVPLATVVINLNATDEDKDPLIYRLTNTGIARQLFSIHPTTGVVTVVKPLTDTDARDIVLFVEAADQRNPPKTGRTNVAVSILRDDQMPSFQRTPYDDAKASEYADVGDVIYTRVKATDGNNMGPIMYKVLGDSIAPYYFSVNETTGVISLKEDLKSDTNDKYQLRIGAYESENPEKVAVTVVTITVTRNENKPNFGQSSYSTEVSENLELGAFIIDLNATDTDNDTLKYTIEGDSIAKDYFYIDGNTGKITLRKLLTTSTQPVYQLRVRVSDQAKPEKSSEVNVQVKVTRDTSAPRITSQSQADIKVDHPLNESVITVSAEDSNLKGDLVYELTGNYPAQNFFQINRTTGEVTLKRPLSEDSLRLTKYTLKVEVYDTEFPARKTISFITVNVNRNSYTPSFDKALYEKEINEKFPVATPVVTVAATDKDKHKLTYKLEADENTLNFFYINSEGVIALKNPLTNDTNLKYEMEVVASDEGKPQGIARAKLVITVNRDRFAPTFSNTEYKQEITENARVDDGIYTVTASDGDKKGKIVYRLVGLPPAPTYFRVDSDSGSVFVRSDLKQDRGLQYNLRIEAFDDNFPDNKASTTLIVSVLRNVFSPEFTESSYEQTVLPNIELGTEILAVNATDKDKDILKYQFVDNNNNCSEFFFLDQTSGQIILKRSLVDDDMAQFNCVVESRDQGYPKENKVTVKVTIKVRRSIPLPTFTEDPYTRQIVEAHRVNSAILTVKANFEQLMGDARYMIEGEYPGDTFFAVDANSGAITLGKDLKTDSLKLTKYTLNVVAYDTRIPSVRKTVAVVINVRRNVNKPVFKPSSYSAEINETFPIGQEIVKVNATDKDAEDVIKYSIVSGSDIQRLFYIDPDTGALSLKQSVKSDTQDLYNVVVQASDQRKPPEVATVTVRVAVPRDQGFPSFDQTYTRRITESAPVNTTVVTVSATDKLKGSMRYKMVGVYPSGTFFAVDSDTGAVTVIADLKSDSLHTENYTVRIEAFDTAYPEHRTSTDVIITVIRNAAAPEFSQDAYSKTINEEMTIGEEVLTVLATDDDKHTLVYGLMEASAKVRHFFHLNPESGRISLIRRLTASNESRFEFKVNVSDQAKNPKSAVAAVTILVERDQAKPKFTGTPYRVEFSENKPVNSTVITVTADDPDKKQKMVFELQDLAPGSNFFGINQETGEIYLKKEINKETTNVYVLYVSTYDSFNPNLKVQARVTITMKRNEFAPKFSRGQYSAEISEHDPVGTNVTRVMATDEDIPGLKSKLTYVIVGDSAAMTYFFCHPNTGDVSIAKKLTEDKAKSKTYTLTIETSDQGDPKQTSRTVVTVTVVRNEKAPEFVDTSSYVKTIPVTQAPSTSVLTVSAKDADAEGPNSKVTYEILGTASAQTYFTINPQSGVISLAKSLYTTSDNSFVITVRARDHGIPPLSSQAQAIITINRERNVPVFGQTEYKEQKPEDLPVGTEIVTVTATDKDCAVKYSITGDGLSTEYFEIGATTGNVTLKKELTKDTSTDYIIRVVAEDTCNPHQRSSAFVRLNVVRNGMAPKFAKSEYTVEIKEIQALGETIFTVEAEDNDKGSGGQVRYSLDAATSTPVYVDKYFFVNPMTGTLSVITSLMEDAAKMEEYLLTIVAKDRGYPSMSSQTKVRVKVSRNIHAPVFTKPSYRVSINETMATGEHVLTVNATDGDKHTVRYTIIGSAPGPDYFKIDKSTGDITVKNPLTYGSDTQYTLIITAVDDASPQQTGKATVVITVTRNPNAPTFKLNFYNVTINEYAPIQTSVVEVQATDKDDPQNPSGTLRYTMRSLTPEATSFFIISPNNGLITVAQPLSYDKTDPKRRFYQMEVTSSDQGIPKKSAKVTVQVNVRRNQFSPKFVQNRYNVTVDSRDIAGTLILTITATDGDADKQPQSPNSVIRYEIDKSNTLANKFFSIDHNKGIISLSQPLINDQDLTEEYEFTVFARDQGQPVQSSGVQVIVTAKRYALGGVGSIGFQRAVYRVSIQENILLNTKIQDLPVIYKDADKNVECYFISGNEDGEFILTTTKEKNCELRVNGNIDHEKTQEYTLKISVRQVSRQKRQATSFGILTVYVIVIDVNDNAPRYIFPPYPDPDKTRNKYFGAISETASPFTTVITVQAKDIDSGVNGIVSYGMGQPLKAVPMNPPFDINAEYGTLITTRELTNATVTPKYRFEVYAENAQVPSNPQRTDTEIIINIIRDEHRMIMVFSNSVAKDLYTNKQRIISELQTLTGHIIIIEKMEDKRTVLNEKMKVDQTGTDLWFVAVNTTTFNLVPRGNMGASVMGTVAQDKLIRVMRDAGVGAVDLVRAPIDPRVGQLLFINKTYVDILDSPWAALIAVAAIIIFLCIVGIIVICFTWARYKRYVQRYSRLYVAPSEPVFMEPPSFLKEYETQSLAMYVPPDETMGELGEINMNFEAEDNAFVRMSGVETTGGAEVTATSATDRRVGSNGGTATQWNGEAGIVGAVNPIYSTPDHGGHMISTSQSSQSQAMLASSAGHQEATITTTTTHMSLEERHESSYYRETTTPL